MQPDESELVKRSKGRDLSAFNQIVEHYQSHVFNLAARILGDRTAAEDVAQETFISAFRTKFTLGALAAFVVSVSGIEIWQVGAAFWGLLFGFALSLLLEREDFRTLNS